MLILRNVKKLANKLKKLYEHLKINKNSFYQQNIKIRLTKSHLKSRKIFPEI